MDLDKVFTDQMAENQEVPEVETTKSSIGASAVERKKNAPSGRRKLTPHPLNPNNASAVEESPSSSVSNKIGIFHYFLLDS